MDDNNTADATDNPLPDDVVSDRQKWAFETRMRERELGIREVELRRSQWSNPLVIAVLTAAAAAAVNFVITYFNARNEAVVEAAKAEQALVLAAIQTGGDVQKAGDNLKFLVDTGLLTDKARGAAITKYLHDARPGTGPALTTSSVVPSPTGQQHYDFPVMNTAPIDPRGWDVDVFACASSGAQFNSAEKFANTLAADADRAQFIGGQKLGRIRFTSGTPWTSSNIIAFDPDEKQVADALATAAKTNTGVSLSVTKNTGASTRFYLSVYFCGT